MRDTERKTLSTKDNSTNEPNPKKVTPGTSVSLWEKKIKTLLKVLMTKASIALSNQQRYYSWKDSLSFLDE